MRNTAIRNLNWLLEKGSPAGKFSVLCPTAISLIEFLLNKFMNNNALNRIYVELKELGFVGNQYDFSTMCGRTPAWFSTIKSRQLPMTADATLILFHNINLRISSIDDTKRREQATLLCSRLIEGALRGAHLKAAR